MFSFYPLFGGDTENRPLCSCYTVLISRMSTFFKFAIPCVPLHRFRLSLKEILSLLSNDRMIWVNFPYVINLSHPIPSPILSWISCHFFPLIAHRRFIMFPILSLPIILYRLTLKCGGYSFGIILFHRPEGEYSSRISVILTGAETNSLFLHSNRDKSPIR